MPLSTSTSDKENEIKNVASVDNFGSPSVSSDDAASSSAMSLSTDPQPSSYDVKVGKTPGSTTGSSRRQFSNSAAKRESVMALGTIAHLQAYYAKQGLAAKQAPTARGALQPALGPAALASLENLNTQTDESQEDKHGQYVAGQPEARRQRSAEESPNLSGSDSQDVDVTQSTWKGKLYPDIAKPEQADPQKLWERMLQSLHRTRKQWDIPGDSQLLPNGNAAFHSSEQSNMQHDSDFHAARQNTLSAFKSNTQLTPEIIHDTTQTIKDVRNYLFALPPSASIPYVQEPSSTTIDPNPDSSHQPSLRRRSSIQFRKEEAAPVKPKDAFKRQSSFSGLPRPDLKAAFAGGQGPRAAKHAPSSFVPFATVKRHNRGSICSSEEFLRADLNALSVDSAKEKPSDSKEVRPKSEDIAKRSMATDPLAVVRSSALNVLGMLRELHAPAVGEVFYATNHNEHRYSSQGSSGLVAAHPPQNDNVSPSLGDHENTIEASNVPRNVPKQSSHPSRSFSEQRELVRCYLTTVDSVLTDLAQSNLAHGRGATATNGQQATAPHHHRGGASERSQSTKLPIWAQLDHRESGSDRLRFILCEVLPELQTQLDYIHDHESLLRILADGQYLCHAFNSVVRRSVRPWGFIPSDSIHDIKGGEEDDEDDHDLDEDHHDVHRPKRPLQSWTFRRTENLKRFSAAVGLRYDIRIQMPSAASVNSTGATSNERVDKRPRCIFDASQVARMEGPHWTDMLQGLLDTWIDRIIIEEQGDD